MCITGEAGGFRNHFGAKKKEKKSGSNVVTFQRRDVVTSRRLVNRRKSQRATQCCNVSMSRCLNVVTSSRFQPQNHKKQKRPNLEGIEECADWSAENRVAATRVIGKDSVSVFFLFS